MPPRHERTTLDSAVAVSREIDAMQEENSRLQRRVRDVLILGAPGSGKTTLLRQMKAIDCPYTDAEREIFKPSVHASLIHALRILFSIVPDGSSIPQISEYRHTILAANATEESARLIHEWWSGYDPMQKLKLEKSTLHFLDRMIPIAAGELPSDLDILFCTVESPALEQLEIEVNSFATHSVTCVCPRQSLRSAYKWLSMFADTDNVMLVLNLNDYDHPENMRLAYDLFNLICNSPFFLTANIFILMNKHPSFPTKLAASPLEDLYPDYTGGSDPRCAIQFLLRRFRRFSPDDHRYITHWILDFTEVETVRGMLGAWVDAFQPRPNNRQLL
ncbi:guanine nucleotide binding protein, alpha subunit [Mycena sanguinolenta]|nr:guanine nucleotide binding protein, alpha subunit [Mycena sanguinolenta]